MNTLLRIQAAGLALLLSQGAAAAATLKKASIGNWSAGAYSNDQTGKFSHCAASASYKSGITLIFAINKKYEWSVGFANDNWHLDKGARYPVSLRVDQGQTMRLSAVAVLPNFAEAQLADSAALFQAFKYGQMLNVYTAGQTFSFRLTDTSSLLPTLLSCVKSYKEQAPETSSNPFVTGEPAEAAPPKPLQNTDADTAKPTSAPAIEASDPERRAEATSLVANILARSGVNGFEILTPEDAQKFKSDAAWRAGESFGTINILAGSKAAPEDINAALLASDSKACHDRFYSGSMPDESGSRLFTSCKSDKQTLTIYYSAIKRAKGGYYVLATGGFERFGQGVDKGNAPRSKPTQDLDSGIRSAAFKVVSSH